jgi:hypothetical protein
MFNEPDSIEFLVTSQVLQHCAEDTLYPTGQTWAELSTLEETVRIPCTYHAEL